MTKVPTFTLNTGATIPAIGYGTGTKWAHTKKAGSSDALDQKVLSAVQTAISDSGFTHIDGAQFYETEPEIAAAIKNAGLARSDLFITTKVFTRIGDPVKALNDSLAKLGTDYVDLYLIHVPFVSEEKQGISLENAWKALEQLHKEGKAKAIGVSNFSIEDLERIEKIATVKPAVNQIEFNPYLQNQTPGIFKYAQEKGILLQAFSPLGPLTAAAKDDSAPLTPVLEKLAEKYSKTPAQILLRWVHQQNVVIITTSEKQSRQKEALDIFDFELSKEDLDEISDVGAKYTFRQFWNDKYTSSNSRLSSWMESMNLCM